MTMNIKGLITRNLVLILLLSISFSCGEATDSSKYGSTTTKEVVTDYSTHDETPNTYSYASSPKKDKTLAMYPQTDTLILTFQFLQQSLETKDVDRKAKKLQDMVDSAITQTIKSFTEGYKGKIISESVLDTISPNQDIRRLFVKATN